MFIDVTRFGAVRHLRLAAAAIAYMDEHTEGSVIKLIGGESLHVEESRADLEASCKEAMFGHLIAGELMEFEAPKPAASPAAAPPQREMVAGDIFPETGGAPADVGKPASAAPARAAKPKAKRQ